MKISIITATLNNKAGLIRAIESVRNQTYKNVEHIIIDGGSTDGSVELIKNEKLKIKNLEFISEVDAGIYDAINKGIRLATGDVIGLLHSDDYYKDEFVLEKYAEVFEQSTERSPKLLPATNNLQSTIESVYSDLVYVREKSKVSHRDGKPKNQKLKVGDNEQSSNYPQLTDYSVIRTWKTHKTVNSETTTYHSPLTTHHLLNGWMPPHPTLFIRKSIFEKYGLYRTDMKIAADYEMVLRLFYKHKITANYLPLTTYCMTIGGASNKSLKNIFIKSSEDFRSMKLNSLPFPLKTLIIKNLRKLPQFFKRDLE